MAKRRVQPQISTALRQPYPQRAQARRLDSVLPVMPPATRVAWEGWMERLALEVGRPGQAAELKTAPHHYGRARA